MNVLVDTGVWLRFLRGEREGLVVQTWITAGQALVHPFVVGELMLGGLSATNERLMHSLVWCEAAAPRTVFDFIRRNGLAGHGIGWVDAALLVAARETSAQLATFDLALARCARRLEIPAPTGFPQPT